MKTVTTNFQDEYTAVLRNFFESQDEQQLLKAAELGRKLVQSNVPLEDIAEYHQQAIDRLAESAPDEPVIEGHQRIFTVLNEMLLAYGGVVRELLIKRKAAEEKLKKSAGRSIWR